MKFIRIIVIIFFILGIGVYGYSSIVEKSSRDSTYPQITSDREVLEITCNYSDADLLTGLKAYDKKDGDAEVCAWRKFRFRDCAAEGTAAPGQKCSVPGRSARVLVYLIIRSIGIRKRHVHPYFGAGGGNGALIFGGPLERLIVKCPGKFSVAIRR